jgi:chorismate mutase
MTDKRLFALRGAVQCENQCTDISEQVRLLYDEILSRNGLDEKAIISVIFSVTPDLDALNPATALRKSGRGGDLALFALQEAPSQGGLPRIIRVLIHCYMEESAAPRHVYRNGARALRPDLDFEFNSGRSHDRGLSSL